MPRPSVLVIDPESSRRRELARGLTQKGYEVVPAVDAAQGRLFLSELGSAVVVAPLGLVSPHDPPWSGDGAAVAPGAPLPLLLLLGTRQEEEQDLPDNVCFLATRGVSSAVEGAALVERVHLLLIGRELGIEADVQLESLVGDFALAPPLEVLRTLQSAGLSAKVVHAAGQLVVEEGVLVAATAGTARGLKAFCRLSQLRDGAFRVVPTEGGAHDPALDDPDLRRDLKSLIITALEDRVHQAPDPRTRVRVALSPLFFASQFTADEQALLGAIPTHGTVGRLIAALSATDGAVVRDLVGLHERGFVVLEERESAVVVVTDSTADLPAALVRSHGLHVVPLMVLFGERIYHDGIDLRPREFYERVAAEDVHPRTNPPLKGDFLDAYRALIGKQDVVSLHISGRLSLTADAARAAVSEGGASWRQLRGPAEPPPLVEVVDSASVSLGLGLLALFAARLARRGLPAAEIARRVEAMRERVHILFVVDSLDALARGGRIGKARALVGNLLGIKPILGVVAGEVVAVDRVRGGRAAHPRLVALFGERIDATQPIVVGIGHAKAPVWADRLRSLLAASFQVSELVMSEIGPAVGTHAGAGTVGAAVFQPTAEELPLLAPPPPT
jgi:DegV family protein with EDD domain